MAKFVRTFQAAEMLETTTASIMVIAHQYKKKHGEYPKWYSTNGKRGASKSYVDVEYILSFINDEIGYYEFATNDLYWYLTETMKLKPAYIAKVMAEKSTVYKTAMTWRSFMAQGLFSYPTLKLSFRTTRLNEFVRIGKEIMNEHQAKVA